ncbi:transcription termination factor Rho [Corynebacterium pacaense]|uniref:transcription termination factor Rho n=1 Tax=Corynebacterium pacaense TaxID=1816684 RepID=UPI0009B9FCD9|nr:transcription termination factor Rho [Corynebacterium pacaense]
MTDTDNTAGNQGELNTLRLPELRRIAADLGLKGTSALRKGDLISAISTARAGGTPPAANDPAPRRGRRRAGTTSAEAAPREQESGSDNASSNEPATKLATEGPAAEKPAAGDDRAEQPKEQTDADNRHESRSAARRARRNRQRQGQQDSTSEHHAQHAPEETRTGHHPDAQQPEQEPRRDNQRNQSGEADSETGGDNNRRNNQRNQSGEADSETGGDNNRRNNQRNQSGEADSETGGDNNRRNNQRNHGEQGEDRRGRRGRRNRRGRDRDAHRDNARNDNDTQETTQHDEPLQDIAGILDIVDSNVAFVRTTGYHAAPSDVFVSNQLIRRMGLRSGDAVTGQVRMNHGGGNSYGGRNRQKYNNLTRVETINGLPAEEARNRPEFGRLTPLYPNQRLRLETEQRILTTRVIDLIMPIGKGQRALIVSPPKAGKTTILQNIANAISTNNPECYLMVVLVDERPEEVTDMQRSVNGEVISSTFDRPPSEHTAVAELAIERAKRLVEQGQDVVVLLDSITRLGRAYNNSSPASGRILSGGVDSNALYPPKRFLGAARNIENGGSLTIIATAMVETGSAGDTVIFEEFKGTGNAELKLDRKISERRVFPAVDVNPSGTRKDELLLNPDEARVMHKLRRILSALDNQQAIDLLIKQLKKTKSNAEFLMQVASSAPMAGTENEEEYS